MAGEDKDLEKQIKRLTELRKKLNDASSVSEQNRLLVEQNELLDEANKFYKKNKAQIDGANSALEGNLDKLNDTNKSLQGLLLVNKGIVGTFKEMTVESAKFSRSTDEWFKKGELLAEQYLKVSKNIGLSEKQSKLVANNFNAAVRESLLLGTSISELEQMMTQFANDTGRARILGEDELENLSLIKEGTGLFETEVASMAEQFDLMGISSQQMVNVLNSAIGSSREMGLNSGKVIKTLQSNFKTMQQYSFTSGVKGMTEMAKQAVRMRIDVSDVLQMADKFYQPEAAIEAAANLQLLGGDIAKAFGDPFETMYLARNKPEELAKRVGKMTENMVSFNDQTGEFDFPAEARMQLQAVSKELGIGMDSLTEMTRQTSKIKSIKMNVSGNILDENMREGIAGMARMKDGKWVVDFAEGGKTMTKSIDELTSEQAKLVMDQDKENKDKTETDYLREIALYTQTFSEKVGNITESQQFGFAAEMDVYGTTMDAFLTDTIDTYKVESTKMFTALTNSFGEGGLVIIDKEYENSVRAACNFGIVNGIANEYGGNYKMIICNSNNFAVTRAQKTGGVSLEMYFLESGLVDTSNDIYTLEGGFSNWEEFKAYSDAHDNLKYSELPRNLYGYDYLKEAQKTYAEIIADGQAPVDMPWVGTIRHPLKWLASLYYYANVRRKITATEHFKKYGHYIGTDLQMAREVSEPDASFDFVFDKVDLLPVDLI